MWFNVFIALTWKTAFQLSLQSAVYFKRIQGKCKFPEEANQCLYAKLTTRLDFVVNNISSIPHSLSLRSRALRSRNTLRQTVHTLFLSVNKQPTDFSSSVKIISPGCNYHSQSMAQCSITITPLSGLHRIKNKSTCLFKGFIYRCVCPCFSFKFLWSCFLVLNSKKLV